MNAQKLLDALNQLPDDLLAETDTLRQLRKQQVPAWKRIMPIAACFVLVLGALLVTMPFLSRKNAAPESQMAQNEACSQISDTVENCKPGEAPGAGEPEAPMEQIPAADGTGQEIENGGAPLAPEAEEETDVSGTTEVPVTGYGYYIGAEEPDEIQVAVISTLDQWNAYLAQMPRLTDAPGFENRYSEDYFARNQLIALVTTAASSSVTYEMHTIRRTGTGVWDLNGIRYSPEWFTDDMTQQLILVELPRMVEPEDTVILNLTEENG